MVRVCTTLYLLFAFHMLIRFRDSVWIRGLQRNSMCVHQSLCWQLRPGLWMTSWFRTICRPTLRPIKSWHLIRTHPFFLNHQWIIVKIESQLPGSSIIVNARIDRSRGWKPWKWVIILYIFTYTYLQCLKVHAKNLSHIVLIVCRSQTLF